MALKEQEAEEWKLQTKRGEDSLKAINRDSTQILKVIDSLALEKRKDSLTETFLQQKFEQHKMLIEPILDTVRPR